MPVSIQEDSVSTIAVAAGRRAYCRHKGREDAAMQWKAIAVVVAMLGGGLASAPALAGKTSTQAALKQAESSLRVEGTITIARDGSVLSHTLEPKSPLGDDLKAFLDTRIAAWKFQPVLVDGVAVVAKVPMHLRLVAKPLEDGRASIAIASTYFGGSAHGQATDHLRAASMIPPRYAREALRAGGRGTVYLVVEVDRQGRVSNVDAEQVNLRTDGTERQMALLREQLTRAAVVAARRWTFETPTTGIAANDSRWLMRVPVDFRLTDIDPKKPDGSMWDTYIPGPRNMRMPWAQEKLEMAGTPDALPDNGLFPLEQGAILLTPPVG
jgi:hypothetical protein